MNIFLDVHTDASELFWFDPGKLSTLNSNLLRPQLLLPLVAFSKLKSNISDLVPTRLRATQAAR